MKKWIAFALLSAFVFGLCGCSYKELAVFGHAVVCPDCGGYRNEDIEPCLICARNENIKKWLESGRNK